jgi:hypothetical protein
MRRLAACLNDNKGTACSPIPRDMKGVGMAMHAIRARGKPPNLCLQHACVRDQNKPSMARYLILTTSPSRLYGIAMHSLVTNSPPTLKDLNAERISF